MTELLQPRRVTSTAVATCGLVVAILFVLAGSASAASLARQLAISPAPGTPDASPQTQISIFHVAPRLIESVRLTGTVSGRHSGRLRRYSGGQGASFVPDQPFTQGERVSASVRIQGIAVQRFSFTVAQLAPTLPLIALDKQQPTKLDHFVSQPDLLPPRISVLTHAPDLPGDVFLTPLPSPVVHPGGSNELTISPVGPGGPMMIDGRGALVWFRQLPSPDYATDLQAQQYRGRRVLTWWQGGVTPAAYGRGEGLIVNSSYRTVATVHAGNGYAMDLHEFRLTPAGDALFTVYSPVLVHLAGTPVGTTTQVLDAIVQEVDVRTGLVVWEWHALGHIPLKHSYATPANSTFYDAFHINAIQPLAGDRILVSARDTSAIYEVDQVGGHIAWTLGGKASNFRLGRGARFYFQHDAELLPDGQISMFDDEAGPPQEAPSSRGLILTLNQRRRTASVAREFHRPGTTSSESEGSLQILPGGNVFLGFGSESFFSEFSATGRLLFDARLPADDGSYREFRFGWSGTPATRPAVVVRRLSSSRAALYVSWNGATSVARWQLLTGRSASSLAPVRSVPKRWFQTQIDLTQSSGVAVVRALSAKGRVLASSRPVAISSTVTSR
jgi:hypothetical protein